MNDSNWDIPYHTECGLPVELCNCIDSPVQADGAGFVDRTLPPAAVPVGTTIAINLDLPGGEDEALRLVQEGMEVKAITLETSEVECPACTWGRNTSLIFDCELGRGGEPPHWVNCQQCGHRIEVSIELLQLIRRVYDGTFFPKENL